MNDVKQALGKVRVVVWSCVREGHRHVEWEGDVARCAEPGCGITSDDTAPWLRDVADATQKAEDNRHEFLLAKLERLESIVNRTILATGDPHLRAEDLPDVMVGMCATVRRLARDQLRPEHAARLPAGGEQRG